jgi:hypothetical protein
VISIDGFQDMKAFVAISPVTSQPCSVRRHSLAWRTFLLNAPFVTLVMNPRSWSRWRARMAVCGLTDRLSEAVLTE